MNVFTPGDHGSTFGGNPLGAAVGLDPSQIVEIRGLIKELAASTTVMISTHILSEVRMLATRIVIMHEGWPTHHRCGAVHGLATDG